MSAAACVAASRVWLLVVAAALCVSALPWSSGQQSYYTFWSGSTPCGLTTDSAGFTYTSTWSVEHTRAQQHSTAQHAANATQTDWGLSPNHCLHPLDLALTLPVFVCFSLCVCGQCWRRHSEVDAAGNAVANFSSRLTPRLLQLANSSMQAAQPQMMAVSPAGDLWSIEYYTSNGDALDISSVADPLTVTYVNLTQLGGGGGITFTP